jgi:hypothetical protein
MIATMKAIRTYNPDKGTKLSTYVYNGIYREFLNVARYGRAECRGSGAARPLGFNDWDAALRDKAYDGEVERLREAVAELTPARRERVTSYLNGESEKDFEARTGINRGASSMRFLFGKKRLALLMGGRSVKDDKRTSKRKVLAKYQHKSGRFPDYKHVEVDRNGVWGVRDDGSRTRTGWNMDAPAFFVARGHWVAISQNKRKKKTEAS